MEYGQGLAIITPEPEKVISEAAKFGIRGKIAGKVIEEKKIKIKSHSSSELVFDIE